MISDDELDECVNTIENVMDYLFGKGRHKNENAT